MKPIMEFGSEADLQAFMHQCLGGDREVKLSPACRIDLRTDQYDIEIKPYLNGPAMDKAAGQIARYSPFSDGRIPVIAGCTPQNFSKSTEALADSFRHAGIEVWFVDQMEVFQEAYLQLNGGEVSDSSAHNAGYDYAAPEWEDSQGISAENPFTFLFWAVIAIAALIGVGINSQRSETAPVAATPTEKKGEATIVKSVNIRKSPTTADDSNIIFQTQPGDIVTLTGNRTINEYAEWVEIVDTKGDRAWIAAPGLR